MKPNLRPLAGKLTEIGPEIMKIGHRKAKLICTGNWQHNLEGNPKWVESESSFYLPTKKKITNYDAQESIFTSPRHKALFPDTAKDIRTSRGSAAPVQRYGLPQNLNQSVELFDRKAS